MLRTTATTSQRPSWSYPERWLPVEITARPLAMRSFPWRPVLILALVALLVAATVAVYVGSQSRIPPPFGPAGNGVLMYRGADGAIVSLDPKSSAQATVVSAADAGIADPVPSRDGRRIALATFGAAGSAPIVITDIGGANRVTLAGVYREVDDLDWSPDDSHLAVVSNVGGRRSITVVASDGSDARPLSLVGDLYRSKDKKTSRRVFLHVLGPTLYATPQAHELLRQAVRVPRPVAGVFVVEAVILGGVVLGAVALLWRRDARTAT